MRLTDPMPLAHPPTDCCTYIEHVKGDVFPPAVAEIVDETGAHFPIFDAAVAGVALFAREAHAPCYLTVKTSKGLTRYVSKITIVPTDPTVVLTSCYKCGRDAVRVPATDTALGRFECRACHAVMYLAPVPKDR